MERVAITVVVAVIAVVVALVLQRRDQRGRPAPVPGTFNVPAQLQRVDFVRPEAEWLVVVFTSATCDSCAGTSAKASVAESDVVAVQEVEVGADPELHRRYGIEGVPTTVIADAEGIVRASFLGPVTATDLWAALAELREPGSVPSGCETHTHLDGA